jgi:hypothetical protein
MLNHCTNKHKWILGECAHEQLPENRTKKWLHNASPAHVALTNCIMDKRLLSTFRHYTHFRYRKQLILITGSITQWQNY